MKFHCSVSSHVKIWKLYSDLVIITKETLSEWYKTLALHVRHLFCNNDWLPARYLLIIEHYEIFFVWLFNMHLGWLLYAGCTAFSRPSLPVIFTFATSCYFHQCCPQVISSSEYINGSLGTGCWRETALSVLVILPGCHFAAITTSSQAALAFG